MKILTPGHLYELANFDNPGLPGQKIQFIHKVPQTIKPNMPAVVGVLDTVADGTTNEEILRVLIDRLNFLNESFPCAENLAALCHLHDALYALQSRTYERQQRNVEGKALA